MPLCVPSPPMKKTISTLFLINASAILFPSNPYLEVPNTVPPSK